MTQPNPVAFEIAGIEVRWYGILIAAGMLIAVLLGCKRASYHKMKDEDVLDACLWIIPIGVIGARLYYVLFNLQYYKTFMDAINIRAGGLAIHGGLIFGTITAIIFCKRRNINPLNLLDLLMPGVALAQAIGRWGNYFNGEAHGGPTDLPWGILVDGVKVHPTFLYESIWCVLLFIGLSYFDKNKRRACGQTFALYCIFYSVERFFVEALRTDSLMIGPFKQAQLISLCAIAFGIVLYKYSSKKFPIEDSKEQDNKE